MTGLDWNMGTVICKSLLSKNAVENLKMTN